METDAVPTTHEPHDTAQRLPKPRLALDDPPARGSALIGWLEAHALFIAAVAAVVVVSLAAIPSHLSQDGWLALVAGRIIAQHGIPSHDYLTVMAYGVPWTDQQWLAQLLMYGLQQLGGLALLTVVYVLITGVAFALAIAAARRLGAEDRHVIALLPLGGFFYLATAVTIRTQGFAYPLFVGTVWLLAADARRPTRRAYLVFPILLLWANLHGSVTLGVGIGVIYGACLLVQGFMSERWHGLVQLRGWAFTLGAPLCLLATPYGSSVISYYGKTLLNPEFGKIVTEWQPITGYTILAVPVLLVWIGGVWAFGRSGRRTPAFDQAVLVVLGLGAIDAVRNVTWFGLAVVILLPATISGLLAPKPLAPRRRNLNIAVAVACVLLTVVMAVTTLARPTHWFEGTYPQRAVSTVRGILARHPDDKIFADVRFADWLVWHDPGLSGRIAYDTSFENLTQRQLKELNSLTTGIDPGQRNPLAPYSVLVLYPQNKSTNRIVLARTHAHVVMRTKGVLIATKGAS